MAAYVNTVTDGMFWPLVVLALWFIVFISTVAIYDAKRGFTVASYISFFLAVPLFMLGFISGYILGLTIFMLAIAGVWIYKTDKEGS